MGVEVLMFFPCCSSMWKREKIISVPIELEVNYIKVRLKTMPMCWRKERKNDSNLHSMDWSSNNVN